MRRRGALEGVGLVAEIVRTVGPPGGPGFDYTSLVTWEATEQNDLQAAGDTHRLECHIGDYTSVGGGLNYVEEQVEIDGWNTDPTHFITCVAPAGNRHSGQLYDGADYAGFTLFNTSTGGTRGWHARDVVFFEFLAVECDHINGRCFGTDNNDGGGIESCIAQVPTDPGGTGSCFQNRGRDQVYRNCIGTGAGRVYLAAGFDDGFLDNCGAFSSQIGFEKTGLGAGLVLRNCVSAFHVGAAYSTEEPGQFDGSDTNAADDGTAPGINPITGVTTADFEDSANQDYNVAAGSTVVKGAGLDLSGEFTNDIAETVRTVPWDVGAFAFVGPAGGFVDLDGALDGVGLVTGTVSRLFAAQGALDGVGLVAGALEVAADMQGALEGVGTITGNLARLATMDPGGPYSGFNGLGTPLNEAIVPDDGNAPPISIAWTVQFSPSNNLSQFDDITLEQPTFTPDGGHGTYLVGANVTNGVGTSSAQLTNFFAGANIDFQGALEGVGDVAGALSFIRDFEGQLDGVGDVVGDLTPVDVVNLEGQLDGVGLVAGTAATTGIVDLDGALEGVGDVVGTLSNLVDAQGALEGVGDVAGTLIAAGAVELQGALEGVGDVTGAGSTLGVVNLRGALEGVGLVVGTAQAAHVLDFQGALEGVGTVTGTAIIAPAVLLQGALDGVGDVTGALEKFGVISLDGALDGVGDVIGRLLKTSPFLLRATEPSIVSRTPTASMLSRTPKRTLDLRA